MMMMIFLCSGGTKRILAAHSHFCCQLFMHGLNWLFFALRCVEGDVMC